ATIGPSCAEEATLARLIAAGVNVFRLNMSHGEQAQHRRACELVRAAAAGEPVALLADLCGPKLRVGRFPAGQIELEAGSEVVVTTRDVPGGPGLISSQYEQLAADVRGGDRILLDDGRLELEVRAIDGSEIRCA